MKVYSTSQYFTWIKLEEGSDRHGSYQCRAVVAAPSKKRAAELLEQTMYTFNNYASETANEKDIKLAMAKPETVIVRDIF